MSKLQDKIKALRGETPKSEKPKKDMEITPVKKKNGGARPGSGRKPKIENLIEKGTKELFDQYANEEVELNVTNPKTGKTIVIKKPRKLIMLQKLWDIAMSMNSHEAAEKWLNRVLGKPAQPIVGDDEMDPVRIEHDISDILDKAYGDD
jgi:hypothetical protein